MIIYPVVIGEKKNDVTL